MTLGKAGPKLAMSYATRRIRLGTTHSGSTPSHIVPVKAPPQPLREQLRKKRR